MRVIAGIYRSRLLQAPEGMNTRPTMDKVKESMFNIIGHKVNNAIVLDLFAGSGALGIEALSRGAKRTYFNDYNYNAIKIIKANLDSLKIGAESVVTKQSYLSCLDNLSEKLDIVILDPPYKDKIYTEIIDKLESKELLNDEAIIVIEADMKLAPFIRNGYASKEYIYNNKKLVILYKQI